VEISPSEFANETLIPTVLEFKQEPSVRRRMIVACVGAYHLCDYLTLVDAGTPPSLVRLHTAVRACSQAVQEICMGLKHPVPKTGNQRFRLSNEVPHGDGGFQNRPWPDGPWDSDPPGFDILVNGITHDVDWCLENYLIACRAAYPMELARVDFEPCLMVGSLDVMKVRWLT
jgi:hypothetical protein